MNKMATLIILFSLAARMLLANEPTLTEETKTLLSEAKSQVKPITPEELKKIMKEEKIILVDVRDPDEWANDTIIYDRQVKISRGFLEIKYQKLILDKYSKNDEFVVYCAMEPRSVFAAQRLLQLGFKHVLYLQGGLKNFNQ